MDSELRGQSPWTVSQLVRDEGGEMDEIGCAFAPAGLFAGNISLSSHPSCLT